METVIPAGRYVVKTASGEAVIISKGVTVKTFERFVKEITKGDKK